MNRSIDVEELIFSFEDAWQCTRRPDISDFLPDDPQLRLTTLNELVHVDLEYRIKSGERIRVERYVEQFPALRESGVLLPLVRWELELRAAHHDAATPAEVERRFPELGAVIGDICPDTVVRSRESTNRSLYCPHCHEPLSVTQAGEQQAVCDSCGSSIDLRDTRDSARDHPDLGRFELLELVGQGAFGKVYKARDTQLDRIVAAKIPRGGRLTSNEDEERFIREARSVAQLNHPGIVALHEVGRIDGVPFLVTDFVEGTTLADLVARRGLPFRTAAVLVMDMAEALQHAHERGVVHRDLKPSNVMLAHIRPSLPGSPDDSGTGSGIIREYQVRLMDFGLARRDQSDVTMTIEGQILGTPAYMSPEQARGETHETDSRTDIYSLGVILYELLTGERPFRGSSRMLIQQVIHDTPPSLRKLNASISRDLETITLKCLEKSPSGRYPTAAALAEDLRRWLTHQPIEARPITRAERAARWCVRNPTIAGLSGALIVSLIVGLALVTWKWREAEYQRAAADAKRIESERVAGAANRVQQIYNNVLEQAAVRHEDPDRAITMRELLDAASAEVHRAATGDPVVRGSVLRTLGETYSFLRMYGEAEQHIREGLELHRQELGANDVVTANTEFALASVMRWMGRLDEARPLMEHARDVHTQRSGPDADATLGIRNNLAELLRELGDVRSSFRMQEELYADYCRLKGPRTPDSLTSANNLAGLYYETGDLDSAARMFREVWQGRVELLGEKHEETRIAVNNLGVVLKQLNRLDEAEECYRIALSGDTEVLGPTHPETLTDVHNLASLLTAQGKVNEAILMFEELIPNRRTALDPEHPLVATSLVGLAEAQRQSRRLEEAESNLREAIAIRKKALPADHWQIPDTEGQLGELLTDMQRFDEAEAVLTGSFEQLSRLPGAAKVRQTNAVRRLVRLYEAWEKPDELEKWKQRLETATTAE